MQKISEMVSRPRYLGAGGCQLFFLLAEACAPLRTARPLLRKTSMTSVDGFNGLGLSRNGLHYLSGKKTQTHQTGSCLMAGNSWNCFHSLSTL